MMIFFKQHFFIISFILLFFSGCHGNFTFQGKTLPVASAEDIKSISEYLDIKYRVINNIPSKHCNKNIEQGRCFQAEFIFTAKKALKVSGWQIHFSQISPIQKVVSKEFTIRHINGDLHQLSLTDKFTGFKQNESKRIQFWATFWSLSESDAMPNFIVSTVNAITNTPSQAQVIKSTMEDIDPETGLSFLPFVTTFTDKNRQFKRSVNDQTQWLTPTLLYEKNKKVGDELLDVDGAIIPTPKKYSLLTNEKVNLRQGLHLHYHKVEKSQIQAALTRLAQFAIVESKTGLTTYLSIEEDINKPAGSYQLKLTPEQLTIIGVDPAGVFYGLQSIAALLMPNRLEVPAIHIIDEPHYPFRGLLVDVARNFHSKAFILRLLEQMAAYKLNKLHLHLADDEGWRLEIPTLPELTEIGAKRCFDLSEQSCLQPQLGAGIDQQSQVNGYFSVEDYQEILTAARARHIQVIPSFDMPGHARAAIKAMAARSKKFIQQGKIEQAQQFNLSDPDDKTAYASIQFYRDNTINVCLASSYHFIGEVMTQVKKIHADAGQPLTRYHIGADETAGAWLDSPACQKFIENNPYGVTDHKELGAYFIERVANMLSDLNIEVAGWSDGLSHTRVAKMPKVVQVNAWDTLFWQGHQDVHQFINQDWQVVLSTPDVLYFDFPYQAHPKEHGYYWASRETNTEKIFQFMPDNLPIHAEIWRDRENKSYRVDDSHGQLMRGKTIIGIQGQLWSENTRSDRLAEYKIYPRLFALAERAWHKADWAIPYNHDGAIYSEHTQFFDYHKQQQRDQQWQFFANVLGQKVLPKLEQQNIFYRLPFAGGKIIDGMLHANSAFPNIVIEYRENQGDWKIFKKPIKVSGQVNLRTRSYHGKRASSTLLL